MTSVAGTEVFADVIAQGNADLSMAADPLPVRVRTGLVSMNYFSVLVRCRSWAACLGLTTRAPTSWS